MTTTKGKIFAALLATFSCLLQLPIAHFFPLLVPLGTCFSYVGALFMIPITLPRYAGLLLGFFIGMAADALYDSWGQHAAASVLFMHMRQQWLNAIYQKASAARYFQITHHQAGKLGLFAYIASLVFLHHTGLFLMEAGGFSHFSQTLSLAALASLYSTLFVIMLFFLLLFRQKGHPA